MVLLLPAVLWVFAASAESLPGRVEVFLSREGEPAGIEALRRRGVTVTLHRIDELEQVHDRLSLGMPSDPERAAEQLKQRLTPKMSEQLVRAWQARLAFNRLGLKRTPAVVVDRERVVYGRTDLRFLLPAQGGRR